MSLAYSDDSVRLTKYDTMITVFFKLFTENILIHSVTKHLWTGHAFYVVVFVF